MNPDAVVYQLIGTEGFTRLTRAFYQRVRTDDILSPMYPPDDWEGSEARLRDFLIFRFGGPQHYVAQRGHPRLRMRHAPFQVDQRARDRWVQLMSAALADVQLPTEAEIPLREFFENTATFMINHAPPPKPGLPLTE